VLRHRCAVPLDHDRLLALVCRELGATDARVLPRDEAEAGSVEANEPALRCALADGRWLVARFAQEPPDRATKQRRLEMLASTFGDVVEETPSRPRSRPPVSRTLMEELQGLCGRAAAANAVVVDAHSPVVWGAAEPTGLGPMPGDDQDSPDAPDKAAPPGPSRAAIEAVRGLSALSTLRKGKHVRHVERGGDAPFLAHSLAGIYLLVVVFDGPFDELSAERAVAESLPRVEQLVLALPPLDPTPGTGAGVMAIRRRRGR
jgi:hypothetical protein